MKPTRKRFVLKQCVLSASVSMAFTTWMTPAFAQENSEANGEVEVVVITGSRVRTGMNTPTPVTSVTADELDVLSTDVLVDGLTKLPIFAGSLTPANPGLTLASPGPGALNMRGLGANRTLVLLDGRRLPSATRYGSADINTIPEALISTVDVVTGGASAAYGTDAIAGVVNVSLNTEFSGVEFDIQSGVTDRNDNDNWQASISAGFDIGSNGHILISGERQSSDPITTLSDREFYRGTSVVPQPGSTPYYLLRDNVVSTDATFDGIIQTFFPPAGIGLAPAFPMGPPIGLLSSLNYQTFSPDGTSISPFEFGDPVGTPLGGGAHSITNGGSGTDIAEDRFNLRPDSERSNVFVYGDYDVGENINVFAQVSFGNSYVDSINPGGGLFLGAWPLEIFPENAYLPESVRDTMLAEGLSSFALFDIGSTQDLAGTHTISDNDILAGTLGFEASLRNGPFEGWVVNGYYQNSETEFSYRQTKVTRTDRYPLAVDAVVDPGTGDIVCNVTLYSDEYDDCVPFNPFGRGNASAEAIDWITGYEVGQSISTPIYYSNSGYDLGIVDNYISTADKVSLGTIDQEVIEISLDGTLFEGLNAGPVSAAFGASYREEEIDQIVRAAGSNPANDPNIFPVPQNDPANGIRGFSSVFQTGSTDAQFSDVPNLRGDLSVTEVFGEMLVPLISGKPRMDQLNFTVAARWADYSASGNIWAWKWGIDAAITNNFRLRATNSRDVRAANFSELYESTGGAEQIIDPVLMSSKTAFFTAGGNPNLNPEVSETLTVGFVYQPERLEGFSLSADWYRIELEDSIGTLSANEILNACFDGATDLCALIQRDPATNEVIRVRRNFLNLDRNNVEGVDIEASYSRPLTLFGRSDGLLGVRMFASWLDENSLTLSTGTKTDYVGQVGFAPGTGGRSSLPEWKATVSVNYSTGRFAINLQERYIGSGYQNPNQIPGVTDIDNNSVPSKIYTDLRLSYRFGGDRYSVFGTITNLTDTKPPPTPGSNIILLTPYNSALYDVIGRRFTVGFNMKM